VYGDGSFASTGRGNAVVPTSGLRKKIGSRARAIDFDDLNFEFHMPTFFLHSMHLRLLIINFFLVLVA
jgi:hypothetical protein